LPFRSHKMALWDGFVQGLVVERQEALRKRLMPAQFPLYPVAVGILRIPDILEVGKDTVFIGKCTF